ncbi:linker between RRM2 and RRM3 domains in RBM39 protein [Bonamia ostreae]|uniref:Linker between RRM2 and RRM3 domains in RBM39 protein n=1 Tax=Bonamia ostreae TaxID=126728 RepID=A0ABV2AIK0_9EUKA
MSATIESQSKFNENNSTQHRLINFENEHPRAQIYIDNLPNSMTKDDLEKLCNPFGEISYIKFLKHKAENPTGYGFVAFSDLNNAYNAIKGVNGKVIESHYIRASFGTFYTFNHFYTF